MNSKQAPFEWTDALVAEYSLTNQKMTLFEFKRFVQERELSLHTSGEKKEGEGKGWEVVVYLVDGFTSELNDIVLKRGADGRFSCIDFRLPDIHDKSVSEQEINRFKNTIHSVRRISDNTVWSVQDDTNKGTINAIEITNGVLWFDCGEGVNRGGWGIKDLSKAPKREVLFKDHLGNNVFEGDEYYFVHSDYLISYAIASKEVKNGNNPFKYAYFKNKSDAEDYVTNKYRCLSLSDIGSVMGGNISVHVAEQLKQLVKERIKQ